MGKLLAGPLIALATSMVRLDLVRHFWSAINRRMRR
jgi:hypothetical protein